MATRIALPASTERKAPRQSRSRATVEAILDASARILGERGWAGFTTNAAAEIAGVSIGSLYQYFPNKNSLVEAVRHRHFDEVLAALRSAADPEKSRAERIEALADGMLAAHSRYPAAYRVLIEESPHAEDARGTHDEFEAECIASYERILTINTRRSIEVKTGAIVFAGAVAGAVHEAARRSLIGSAALRQEIVALVEGYLSAEPKG